MPITNSTLSQPARRGRAALRFMDWLAMGLAVILALGVPPSAKAQQPERLADIPSDAIAVLSVDVDDVMALQSLRYVAWEIATAVCQEQFGFALEEIASIDVAVFMPSPQPEIGISIRTLKPFDIEELNDAIASGVQTAPKDPSLRFRDIPQAPMMRIAQKDPSRVLVGTQGALRRMLSSRIQTGGPTVSLVQKSKAPLRLALNVGALRDLSMGMFQQNEAAVPEALREDVYTLIALVDNAMLELIPSEETPIRLSLGASSSPNAESILESMDRLRSSGLEMARENVTLQLQQNQEVSDAIKEAIRKYSDRVQRMVNDETLWSLQGDRVEFNMESSMMANYSTIGVLTGLLLPAVQSAREAARRMSSSNNMKQILLAMHNYHSAYNRFPTRVSTTPDGSPLHSWRVQLLPFLEEVELYNQFRMNEPWDSPHNLELAERMPAIYRSPQVEAPPGHTVYLAPFGTDTGWPEKGLRISDILDGSSNTIGVVEVTPELAVPWTMPDDLDLDQNPAGEWISPRGANIGMFDGSVQRISPTVSADVLRALFTPKGAEAIPFPR